MIRFQVRLFLLSCFLESKPTDYLSREYYLKVGDPLLGLLEESMSGPAPNREMVNNSLQRRVHAKPLIPSFPR